MKKTKLLFIDRDGTLIQEPEDEQIDSFAKLVFTKGVFRNLSFIAQHTDFKLIMVNDLPENVGRYAVFQNGYLRFPNSG